MNTLDWTDLQYVHAVAQTGSAAAAARLLDVSHATVLRRIQGAEKVVGSPLFERLATGYVVTEAGRALTAAGDTFDTAINDARRLIEGRTAELSGTIRFTTTDSLGCTVVPALLAAFHERYPEIKVEVAITNGLLDLDKRDADVTLRPSAHPPESWVGMRLVRMDFGLFATDSTLETASAPNSPPALADLRWLLPSGPLEGAPSSQWLRSLAPSDKVVLSVDSFIALSLYASKGIGATVLPLFVAGLHPELRAIQPAPHSASVDVWILTHADLKQSARINAFMTHIAEGMRELRGSFEAG